MTYHLGINLNSCRGPCQVQNYEHFRLKILHSVRKFKARRNKRLVGRIERYTCRLFHIGSVSVVQMLLRQIMDVGNFIRLADYAFLWLN